VTAEGSGGRVKVERTVEDAEMSVKRGEEGGVEGGRGGREEGG